MVFVLIYMFAFVEKQVILPFGKCKFICAANATGVVPHK